MSIVKKIATDWQKDLQTDKEGVYGYRWGGLKLIEELTNLLDGEIQGTVLEIGCGGGRLTKWLFEMGASSVIACDVHKDALRKAKEHESRAKYVLINGEDLPEGDFDIVFSWGVFLHLPDFLVQHYISQARRIGKKLIFALPDFTTPGGAIEYGKRIKNKAWRQPFRLGYVTFYTPEQIEDMCHFAGWDADEKGIVMDWNRLYTCK